MKHKAWMTIGVLFTCLLFGCVKDLKKAGINETTLLRGRVLEESQRVPLPQVKVKVTDGQIDYHSTTSGNDGEFMLEVNFTDVGEQSYIFLEMQKGSVLITKQLDLKGMGKDTYDYDDVFLYNRNEDMPPSVTTNIVSDITANSAVCGGNVTSDGGTNVTERGICWAVTQDPTVLDSKAEGGSGTGSFTCVMDGLSSNTNYYVRAYAINSTGISYGVSKSFTTLEANSGNTVPVVTTNPVSAITTTSAVCGGNVTSDGGLAITRRGICWSTSPHPVLNTGNAADNHQYETGSYSCTMTGLSPNTTYYVRAFAVNDKGTGYGEDKIFTTTQATTSGWLTYYDDSDLHAWGLTHGGDDEWAVMFPASDLVDYEGTFITKVHVYINVTGRYTLKIYEGGTNEPTSLKKSMYFDVSSLGWKNLLVNPGYSLNSAENLWVSLAFSYNEGQYPKAAGDGVNNPNARWDKSSSGLWYDVYDYNGQTDVCWTIEAYVTNEEDGDKGIDYVLPSGTSQTNDRIGKILPSKDLETESIKSTIMQPK